MDCLGPWAKVENCPIAGTKDRRTCYATGYADTFFSVPARCSYRGINHVRGYFTADSEGSPSFNMTTASRDAIAALPPSNPCIIELTHNGDPYGRGFVGALTVDGGESWIYCGDIGARSRWWWRCYCRRHGYILREVPR